MTRTHPGAVEREQRPARRERALDDRMAEEAVQPAQRPAERQPLVDIAEDDDTFMDRSAAHNLEQFSDLETALGGPEAEVGDDDAHRLAADLEVDVERVARLAAGVGEAEAA